MNRPGPDSAGFETSGNSVGPVLCASENENGIELRVPQKMEEECRLQVRLHFVNKLRHCLSRVRPPADLYNPGGTLKLVRQFLDFSRERG